MSHALAVVHDDARSLDTPRQSIGLLRPIAPPADVLVAQEQTRAMIKAALQPGRDFGNIPGIDKPSLLKPGAERIALAFGCSTRFSIVTQEIDHNRVVEWVKRKKKWANKFRGDRAFTWEEEHGTSLGLYRYVVECEIVHRESGQVVGACIGSCSSMESKYIDRPRDSENTIIKMAEKRAMVGAALTTFGLSEQFTQDVEDLERPSPEPEGEESSRPTTRGDSPTSDTPSGTPTRETASSIDERAPLDNAPAGEEAACPKCSGRMWDNSLTKTNPKAPDFKCRDKACDGVFWPGQWPPKPNATQEQRVMIVDLMAKATLTDKMRQKINAELADTAKPLSTVRASEIIGKLHEKMPEPTATAAPAPQADLQSTLKELPF